MHVKAYHKVPHFYYNARSFDVHLLKQHLLVGQGRGAAVPSVEGFSELPTGPRAVATLDCLVSCVV